MPINIERLVVFSTSLPYKEKKFSRLNSGMPMIFANQARRLSRRLLIGLLVIGGMFPLLVQAEIWRSTTTSGMRDVAVAPNGIIWLTAKNGTVWTADNVSGSSFTQIDVSGFSRISVGPDGIVWAVKTNGTLWKFAADSWTETAASEMEDVAIAPDGKVWLAGKNGAIWFSDDQGKNFTQIEANDFNRISVGPDGTVWAVKTNGTLWKFAAGSWVEIVASGIGDVADVAIARNGLIWLVGRDGTIWGSTDEGGTFSQYEEAKSIENIAAGRGNAWAVGLDGALWRKLFSPQF